MEAVEEVPQYFLCPISLQLMRDPVTAPTGITYDRESIERWLFVDRNATCPLTNQPLPPDGCDLTPNHTLRRLIQAWCTLRGHDRIPTPKPPIDSAAALSLLCDLSAPHRRLSSLRLLTALAADSESNRRCLLRAAAPAQLIRTIVSCAAHASDGASAALTLLLELHVPPDDLAPLVIENHDLVNALTPLLRATDRGTRSNAVLVLKSVFEVASHRLLERLPPDLFEALIVVLRDRISQQATKAALHALLWACPWGRNRIKIAECGASTELIELELTAPDKRTTELVLAVLGHLCACAEGRAQVVGHAAGIALVSKRILRVSPAADDHAVSILSSVCKHSATHEVLHEMLRVGAVSKLCFVLQTDCSSAVKQKATLALRLHSGVWRNSPCVKLDMLSRYP